MTRTFCNNRPIVRASRRMRAATRRAVLRDASQAGAVMLLGMRACVRGEGIAYSRSFKNRMSRGAMKPV